MEVTQDWTTNWGLRNCQFLPEINRPSRWQLSNCHHQGFHEGHSNYCIECLSSWLQVIWILLDWYPWSQIINFLHSLNFTPPHPIAITVIAPKPYGHPRDCPIVPPMARSWRRLRWADPKWCGMKHQQCYGVSTFLQNFFETSCWRFHLSLLLDSMQRSC